MERTSRRVVVSVPAEVPGAKVVDGLLIVEELAAKSVVVDDDDVNAVGVLLFADVVDRLEVCCEYNEVCTVIPGLVVGPIPD